MTLQKIPVSNDLRQTFDTALGDQLVRFTVWWQPFDSSWYLSLAWQTGANILTGRRLVVEQNVLAGIVTTFNGSIVVHGIEEEIGREAWDVTHEIIFDSEG